MNNDETLEELLRRNKISQKTYDKVKIKNSKKLHSKKIQSSNNKEFRMEWNNRKNKFFKNTRRRKRKSKKRNI